MRIRKDERRNHPTVLENPSVTIYMDGLMLLFHGERSRLTQAAIHVQAAHHELQILVFDKGGDLVWPRDWDGSHQHVKSIEPLWLFVDSGRGAPPPPDEYSSSLHLAGDQSFGRVLDFESELYNHRLEDFRRDRVAVLNMPHGVFYSATHEVSELHSFEQGQTPEQAAFERDSDSSTLGAADIDSRSTAGSERSIVLWQSNPPRQLFSFPLGEESNYEIHVFNVPVPGSPHMPAHAHFLRYYDLFRLRRGERKFLLKAKPDSHKLGEVLTPDSPPCNVGQGTETEPVL